MIYELSDSVLLTRTKELVREEREILTEVLRHLKEIDRRKLYCDLKYKSLFEYAVQELGYSEDQAWRRINAMRVTRDLPQVEAKIESGELTLGSLSVATSLFRAEAKEFGAVTTERKLAVLRAIEGRSRKEAERIAQKMALTPSPNLRSERTRQINGGLEIRFNASPELEQKMTKIKGILAHKHPYLDTAGLLELLCDRFLTDHERKFALPSAQPRKPASRAVRPGRFIPIAIRRQVWRQCKSKCENCGSEYALEIDHIRPVALGGCNSIENLRLLCRPCNQRAAIVTLHPQPS